MYLYFCKCCVLVFHTTLQNYNTGCRKCINGARIPLLLLVLDGVCHIIGFLCCYLKTHRAIFQAFGTILKRTFDCVSLHDAVFSRIEAAASINVLFKMCCFYLEDWLHGNKLSFNIVKAQSIIIGSGLNIYRMQNQSDEKASFEIDNEKIEMVNNITYLGVYLDNQLKWD